MRFCRLGRAAGCFAVVFCLSARAQFYAPETDYHDQAQRTFVVELARILAWRESPRAPSISEVTYQVKTNAAKETVWEIQWLTSEGKIFHQAKVHYPESLLLEEPRFYRSVFHQLWDGTWKPLPKIGQDELHKLYWQGAAAAGLSRMDGLRAAFKLAPKQPDLPESDYAPRLAGLLAHTCLPSLAGSITLDSVLLARSAAWLCLAEDTVKDTAPADVLWVPVIFLAGREPAACELWKQSAGKAPMQTRASHLFAWWDCLLHSPTQREAFLFAARLENRSFAMPMLVYFSKAGDRSSRGASGLRGLAGADGNDCSRVAASDGWHERDEFRTKSA